MDKQIKLSEWIQRFKSGEFDKPDTTTQINAGWFDWFCSETSYVWFKNNCPLNGPLYDDFRIADIENNNNLFVVQIDCVWNDSKYTVFERLDGFEKPVFQTESSRELVKWFNKGWSK
jgi:hypothetical protein